MTTAATRPAFDCLRQASVSAFDVVQRRLAAMLNVDVDNNHS
jgi:hypothetical protein